jgi:hypothetical protein
MSSKTLTMMSNMVLYNGKTLLEKDALTRAIVAIPCERVNGHYFAVLVLYQAQNVLIRCKPNVLVGENTYDTVHQCLMPGTHFLLYSEHAPCSDCLFVYPIEQLKLVLD